MGWPLGRAAAKTLRLSYPLAASAWAARTGDHEAAIPLSAGDRHQGPPVGVLWVPIIRSRALTRGFALHPGTRNRYEIRYTRTQHRPASRQVNDHGRVSGTHVCPEGK